MRMYKPSPLAMISIYIFTVILSLGLCIACGFGAMFMSVIFWYVMLFIIVLTFLILTIVVPLFFSQSRYSVSRNEVICRKGVFIFKRQYMKISSVRSFTAVVTPLSGATGLNFLVIHSLGARMVLLFLSKKDLNEITSRLDKLIRKEDDSSYETA
jgi:membrane protein YdbS with pleckstrin-like domain